MEEAQAGIKTARRNINNLRYADDTTLMAENSEELKQSLNLIVSIYDINIQCNIAGKLYFRSAYLHFSSQLHIN